MTMREYFHLYLLLANRGRNTSKAYDYEAIYLLTIIRSLTAEWAPFFDKICLRTIIPNMDDLYENIDRIASLDNWCMLLLIGLIIYEPWWINPIKCVVVAYFKFIINILDSFNYIEKENAAPSLKRFKFVLVSDFYVGLIIGGCRL